MNGCIFCKIINKEIPTQFVYEGPGAVAFKDIQPQAPVHILIVPRKHIAKVLDLASTDTALLGEIHQAAQTLANKFSVDKDGFRLVVNNGPNAGQAVDHLHYHLLGGRKFLWPPG